MLHYVACVYVRKVVSRRQELGKFFIEIMSNLNLFVAGSIHQGSERFYSEFHAEDNVLSCVFQRYYLLRLCRSNSGPHLYYKT